MLQRKTLYLFGALFIALLGVSGCKQTESGKHIPVQVVMKKYSITPTEIRVKEGEMLRFEVHTEDVQHGISIPELGINQPVNPGKPAYFTYKAVRKGTFNIECSVICGRGHDDMRAKLVVE